MRNDFEKAVAESLVAYLAATLDSAITDVAPVVAFFDPMSIDDANRIVIACESGETKQSGATAAVVETKVEVKSLLRDPSMTSDVAGHFERVNAVRDLFNLAEPFDESIAAYNVAGIAITNVEPRRRFSTDMNRSSGFITSELVIQIHCHTTTE